LEKRRDDIAARALDGMSGLPTTGAKVFIRRDGFMIVGLLVDKYNRVDTSSGDMRTWGWIKTLDWKDTDEPLDRKNRLTGEIESCICWENNQVVITARRTKDLRDDDDNFMWLMGAPDANAWKEIRDKIKTHERTIHSLERELEGKITLIARLSPQVEALGTENASLKADLDALWPDLVATKRQLSSAYLQLQAAIGITREAYGALEEVVRTARDRGIDMGSSDIDRARRSMEKIKGFQMELGSALPPGGAIAGSQVAGLEKQIADIKETIERALAGGRPAPAPKPAAPEVAGAGAAGQT
jgi:chromosome segregation ATPase